MGKSILALSRSRRQLDQFLHTGERGGHQEIRPLKDRFLRSLGSRIRGGPLWDRRSLACRCRFRARRSLGLDVVAQGGRDARANRINRAHHFDLRE
jgi:hypothetical protein